MCIPASFYWNEAPWEKVSPIPHGAWTSRTPHLPNEPLPTSRRNAQTSVWKQNKLKNKGIIYHSINVTNLIFIYSFLALALMCVYVYIYISLKSEYIILFILRVYQIIKYSVINIITTCYFVIWASHDLPNHFIFTFHNEFLMNSEV